MTVCGFKWWKQRSPSNNFERKELGDRSGSERWILTEFNFPLRCQKYIDELEVRFHSCFSIFHYQTKMSIFRSLFIKAFLD